MDNSEMRRLRGIAENSKYASGIAPKTIQYSFEILVRHIKGQNVLEMGPAEGVMTELLVTTGKDITVVEGSEVFCKKISSDFPEVHVHNLLFEEFLPKKKFDTIVLGHVLEHVDDPVGILKRVRMWLASGGVIFAAVPNARSIHRQAAADMGMIAQEHDLSELDVHHGHRRVFDPELFRAVFKKADFRIDVFGGYWLKPVSNAQIEEGWTPEMLSAFMRLGERYPDIAAEIYVVASC